MNPFFNNLTQIRKQLVVQQSSINECLATIDAMIISQISGHPIIENDRPVIQKKFPTTVTTKRDKLKHILSEENEPMTAKEVRIKLLEYGEELPNVDQSLGNLEKDELIGSTNENGRKKYYIKK